MKNFKYAVLFLSALFCWGVMGSLELDRISLSEAIGYVAWTASLCFAIISAEAALKIFKLFTVRQKRKMPHNAVKSCVNSHSGRRFAARASGCR